MFWCNNEPFSLAGTDAIKIPHSSEIRVGKATSKVSFERVCVACRWCNHAAISLPLSSQTNRPNWLFPRPLLLIGRAASF